MIIHYEKTAQASPFQKAAACYNGRVAKATKQRFDEALKAAERLPEAAQEALAEELRSRIHEYADSHMSDVQRTEVKRRLALPRRHVDTKKVHQLLKSYNPTL